MPSTARSGYFYIPISFYGHTQMTQILQSSYVQKADMGNFWDARPGGWNGFYRQLGRGVRKYMPFPHTSPTRAPRSILMSSVYLYSVQYEPTSKDDG